MKAVTRFFLMNPVFVAAGVPTRMNHAGFRIDFSFYRRLRVYCLRSCKRCRKAGIRNDAAHGIGTK